MKIGIFGAGHMGGAMIKGWVRSNNISPTDILVKGGKGDTAKKLQQHTNSGKIKRPLTGRIPTNGRLIS